MSKQDGESSGPSEEMKAKFREALAILFQRANEKYRVEPDVPYNFVSIHVTNVDFTLVLAAVTRLSNADYALRGDTYVIRRRR